MKIYYSAKFLKGYKRLPVSVKEIAEEKEAIFRKNPFDGSLRTHKLGGKLSGYWSFSLNLHYRIIFVIEGEDVWFLVIGGHEIYN